MTEAINHLVKKSFDSPEETLVFEKLQVDLVTLGNTVISRNVYQPGWRWSEAIWPLIRTRGCPIRRAIYVASGRLHVIMNDGETQEFGPGDVGLVPPGHDYWVVGDEPVTLIDFGGEMSAYAKKR